MNIANRITIIRILMIPFFIYFMLANIPYHMEISLGIFIIASLTDKLDGYLARKYNLITDFGKFIDPLADKLLVTGAFVALIQIGKVEAWIVFIILTREFAVTGLRGIAAAQNIVIAASNYGKVKTVSQFAAIIALMSSQYINICTRIPIDNIILYFSLIMTILSGLDYFIKNKQVFVGKM